MWLAVTRLRAIEWPLAPFAPRRDVDGVRHCEDAERELVVAWSTSTLPATVVMASTPRLGRCEGQDERERIVDAGIGVDDAGAYLTGSWGTPYHTRRPNTKEDRMDIRITYCGE